MRVKELRAAVASIPAEDDELEVKVWLPGSRITVGSQAPPEKQFTRSKQLLADNTVAHAYLIEGNVDEGSALCR